MSSEEDAKPGKEKKNNVLPLWGNERSMNLNPLILTNIQSSHYFKVNLYELKTYHEVIDEIYYKVSHLEPWEKGSRKTAGQTGMCGGVRGVGAGGIVSTAYCLLYKLFTLKLTRKQINGLLTHPDSPYIRALGFMYIRYTQPPPDLWDWYDEYLQDPEEMDVKAGGGHVMTIGNMLHHFLTKLEWFSTLFPRIPVPIQQKLARQLSTRFPQLPPVAAPAPAQPAAARPAARPRDDTENFGEAERVAKLRRCEGEGRSPSLGQGRSPRDSPSHVREKEKKVSPRDSPSNHRERERERRSSPRDSPSNHRERERRGSPRDSPSNHREKRDSPPHVRDRNRESKVVSPRHSPSIHRERERSPPQSHHREREKSPPHHRGEKRSSKGSSPVRKHRRNSLDRHPEQADHVNRRDHEPDYRHERHDREEFRHRNRGDRSNGHSRDKERHHRSHRNEEQSSSRHRSSHGKDFASELAREKDRQQKRDRSTDRTSSRHSPSSRKS